MQLPERGEAATRNRLLRRYPTAGDGAPPAQVQRAIDDIVALLGGERRDLSHVTIDIGSASEFHRRVYEAARRIPADSTLSYGELAERLGDRNLARDVAEALSENPCPIIVPCHRILAAGGKPGGFSAPGRRSHKASTPDDRRRTTRRPHALRPIAAGHREAAPLTAH